jgi:hypothetical protein
VGYGSDVADTVWCEASVNACGGGRETGLLLCGYTRMMYTAFTRATHTACTRINVVPQFVTVVSFRPEHNNTLHALAEPQTHTFTAGSTHDMHSTG